jgi:hypothetical protein
VALQISHVLINVYDLGTFLVNLVQEALNKFSKFRVFFLNDSMIFLVLASDMVEEFLEMLRIIHYQLVDDCLMKINTWELV